MASLRKLIPAALIVCLTTACSDREKPTAPEGAGRYVLAGRVTLTAILTDETTENGVEIVLGTRVVQNASGFRVRLQRPDGTVDSTLTVRGRYVFRADEPGLYRASCWVTAPDTVATTDVVLVDADVAFPDTLKISRSPGLSTYPNPFGPMGMGMEGVADNPQRLLFRVLRLDGTQVWSTAYDIPGVNSAFHTHWIGVDDAGAPVPTGSYWAVVDRDGARFHSLVFRE